MPRRRIIPPEALALSWVVASGCGSTTILEDAPTDPSTVSASSTGSGGGSVGAGGDDAAGTGTGGAGGAPSEGPWRADMWIGQVDHLSIRHHALEADVCLLITATAPSQDTTYDVTIPEPWAVDMISAYDGTEGCLNDPFTPMGDPAFASEALGTVTFYVPAMQFYPCEIDVELELFFATAPAWTPGSLSLATSMLAVGGACN